MYAVKWKTLKKPYEWTVFKQKKYSKNINQ